jgi:Putative NADPH-quinone reductase (modulator of drug activity B)
MQGKEIGIAISTYGSKLSYTEGGSNLFTIEDLTKPIQSICNFINARFLPPFSLSDISNVTDEELEQSKHDYVKYIRSSQTATV